MTVVRQKLDIVVDPKTKDIRVGNWVADDLYYNYPRSEKYEPLKREILIANNVPAGEIPAKTIATGLKEFHQVAAFHLGSRFYDQLKKVFVTTWVEPIRPFLDQYCLNFSQGNRASYIPAQVVRAWHYQDECQWLGRYGLLHLTPIVLHFGLHPTVLRNHLGKVTWKRLCRQPKTRVAQLASLLCTMENYSLEHLMKYYPDVYCQLGYRASPLPEEALAFHIERLTLWLTLKTATLKCVLPAELHEHGHGAFHWGFDDKHSLGFGYQYLRQNDQELLWLEKYAKPSNKESYLRTKHLLRDTRRMAEDVGREFTWCNLRQMQIRHNIFARIIREEQRKRLSEQPEWREPMRWTLPYVEKIKKSPSTDVIITVLNTPEMLWEESVEMSHCVDSFLLECQSEEMLVFRLVSKKSRSTLGFERIGDEWDVFQHYAFDNQPVKCQALQKEESRLLALLNDDLLAHH